MSSSVRRHSFVIALVLLTAAVGMGLQPRQQPIPALPPIAALTAGSNWHVETVYQPGGLGMVYRQWLLRNAQGQQVLLYVGATARVQVMIHWTGELGYEGEGYLVQRRDRQTIRLRDESTATVSATLIQRLADRRLVESAVVGPDGISTPASNNLLHTAWLVLSGATGPYYLVRVSVQSRPNDQGARTLAAQLLSPVLSALQQQVRSGTNQG